jgi:NAD(P)-dependent dehydrogenase (short-subunit alcohol dehydrogenase family)
MSEPTKNPVALITGAARGIGRRTAEVLAERGYALVLNDLNPADETEKAAHKFEVDVMQALGDVSVERDSAAIADKVLAHYGRLDVLVNNAGISLIAPALETSPEQWRRVLDINLTGPFLLCRKFGRVMLEQRSGSIVNVASIAGLVGIADRAAYNASKHGLIGLTKTLAAEWGGFGVRCNAVCPGWVKTEMDAADQARGTYSDADICSRVPMGRFAKPDDVAQAIAFLADPKQSGFLNGHTLAVDGGWISDGSWETLRLQHRPKP